MSSWLRAGQLLKYANRQLSIEMAVLLSSDQLLFIIAHARNTYPEECCGFLIGSNSDHRIVRRALATRNTANPRLRRYSIEPQELIRVDDEARRTNLELLGIYHSHPDAPVAPSKIDLEYAWPKFTYLVLSLQGGEPYDVGAWSLNRSGTGFEPDELEVF